MTRRVLVVAYYFPPIGGIGSIRMSRFVACLPEFGWAPTVLAPRGTPHPVDHDLRFRSDLTVRALSIELSRAKIAIPASVAGRGTRGTRLRQRARSFAHRHVFYPDAQVGWYPAAVAKGLGLLRRERFDLIYSSSNPITAHLVARTLSRRAGLPWVAEFRDPWSEWLGQEHPHHDRAIRLEDSLARAATTVVVPTPTLVAHYRDRWQREPALVSNGHDLDSPAARPPERFTVTHVGSYYPDAQSYRPLWEALARLRRTNTEVRPRIRFVGRLPEQVRSETEELRLDSCVEATGLLPHREAVNAMLDSSLLVLSGFSCPLSRGVISGKLFEYLASDLPILYIGDQADDAARLLEHQPGGYVVQRSDVDGILAVLREVIANPTTYRRDVERFRRRARTAELAAVFGTAINT